MIWRSFITFKRPYDFKALQFEFQINSHSMSIQKSEKEKVALLDPNSTIQQSQDIEDDIEHLNIDSIENKLNLNDAYEGMKDFGKPPLQLQGVRNEGGDANFTNLQNSARINMGGVEMSRFQTASPTSLAVDILKVEKVKDEHSHQKSSQSSFARNLRQRTPLDTGSYFHSTDQERSASQNMTAYMENFGIEFNLPSLYVKDAKIYPTDPRYNLQLINMSFPMTESVLKTHYLDGTIDASSFSDKFANFKDGLSLRLLLRDYSSLNKVAEVNFPDREMVMKFHHRGDMFGLFSKDTQAIRILNCVKKEFLGFIDTMKSAEKNKEEYLVYFEDPSIDLSFVEDIEFDQNKRFLIAYGGTKLFVLNIETKKGRIYPVSSRIYDQVSHVSFKSESSNAYECIVACLRKDIKQVAIFDLVEDIQLRTKNESINHGEDLETIATINFLDEVASNFKVRISKDFNQIIFANGSENAVLEKQYGKDKTKLLYYNQRKLKQVKTKSIVCIAEDVLGDGFYLLGCEEYDGSISVCHSNRKKVRLRFRRSIEPGIVKIFDFNICQGSTKSSNPSASSQEIRILSLKDDEFLLDKITYEEILKDIPFASGDYQSIEQLLVSDQEKEYTQKNAVYFQYVYSPIRAFSICWPYVTFTGISNYIIIVNAFDRKTIRRIQVAEEDAKITINETYITETNDLFVVIQERDIFSLYKIDLDASNEFEHKACDYNQSEAYKLNFMMSYKEDDVQNQPLKQIHVRGSSAKQDQDFNEKLQVFLLHGNRLYTWVCLNEKQRFPVKFIMNNCSRLQPMNDQCFYFFYMIKDPETKVVEHQEIIMIKALFSSHEEKSIYNEKNFTEKIITFSLDQFSNKIIIMSKTEPTREATLKTIYVFKIFDLDDSEIVYETELVNEDLIGRLKSGLFIVTAGHIYYKNNVIKIRYDLIERNKGIQYSEDQIFDIYYDCFHLDEGEKVRANTPLDSIKSHRFAYVISDTQRINPIRLLILPYLHERRIYLNRRKMNTDYFYTTIETDESEEQAYYKAVDDAQSKGESPDSVDIVAAMQQKSFLTKRARSIVKPGPGQESFTSIISMHESHDKYYVYQQNGILINRIDFSSQCKKYGHPLQVSNNGQVYIVKKTTAQLEDIQERNLHDNVDPKESDDQLKREFLKVSILKLTIFGMQHIKDINILDHMEYYISQTKGEQQREQFKKENSYFTKKSYELLSKTIDFEFLVNDHMDLLVRIRYKQDFEDHLDEGFHGHSCLKEKEGQETTHNTIYYYENSEFKYPEVRGRPYIPSKELEQNQGIYTTKNHKSAQFIMNRKYLFFWEHKKINILQLDQEFCDENLKSIPFKIDIEDKESYISEIRTGSFPDLIVLIVKQGNSDFILTWNMITNSENEAYEINEDYLVIWDSSGKPYIATENKLYMTEQRCAITAYDYSGIIESFKQNKSILSVHKGHRVDSKNHNWLIFEEYLTLPFSYMTFVIKDKIEKEDPSVENNEFDPEPYNYIFNKCTSFIEGAFVIEDHFQLKKVLTHFEIIDGNNLEILNYTQDIYEQSNNTTDKTKIIKNSALHRAVREGNQRSIDFILQFMSKINFNSSRNFRDLMAQLIEHANFIQYFKELPVQTSMMVKKQTLRQKQQFNDSIVGMASTSCIYIDNVFFKDRLKEGPNEKSYPVKMTGLRVGWIINEPEGKEFLQAILQLDNLELYKIESLQMIIEFLFMKFKFFILAFILPLYLFSHLTYEQIVGANDDFMRELWNEARVDGEVSSIKYKCSQTDRLKQMAILNGIALFFQFIQMLIQGYTAGWAYFERGYSFLDLGYCLMNILTYIGIFNHFQVTLPEEEFEQALKQQRIIAVIGTFTLYFKASYFLSLFDQIAPLIDIIFQIVKDSGWFIVVLVIYSFMMATNFYILAKSQMDFDDVTEPIDLYRINSNYGDTRWNAMFYVINMWVGNVDNSGFGVGNHPSQYWPLAIVWIIAILLIIVHFMNMLIAIMGNTFGERTEVGAQIMLRDHLRFVIDNWVLMKFINPQDLKYIVCAFQAYEDTNEKEDITQIKDSLNTMMTSMNDQFKKNAIMNRNTQLIVQDIKNRFEDFENSQKKDAEMNQNQKPIRVGGGYSKANSKRDLFA